MLSADTTTTTPLDLVKIRSDIIRYLLVLTGAPPDARVVGRSTTEAGDRLAVLPATIVEDDTKLFVVEDAMVANFLGTFQRMQKILQQVFGITATTPNPAARPAGQAIPILKEWLAALDKLQPKEKSFPLGALLAAGAVVATGTAVAVVRHRRKQQRTARALYHVARSGRRH